jgi:hypothetical protein
MNFPKTKLPRIPIPSSKNYNLHWDNIIIVLILVTFVRRLHADRDMVL